MAGARMMSRIVAPVSTTPQTDLVSPAARVAGLLRPRMDGQPWPDLGTYKDQPVCVRCGRDETGLEWPCCGDLVKDCPDDVRDEAHFEMCLELFRHDWLCAACKQIVPAGRDS